MFSCKFRLIIKALYDDDIVDEDELCGHYEGVKNNAGFVEVRFCFFIFCHKDKSTKP